MLTPDLLSTCKKQMVFSLFASAEQVLGEYSPSKYAFRNVIFLTNGYEMLIVETTIGSIALKEVRLPSKQRAPDRNRIISVLEGRLHHEATGAIIHSVITKRRQYNCLPIRPTHA